MITTYYAPVIAVKKKPPRGILVTFQGSQWQLRGDCYDGLEGLLSENDDIGLIAHIRERRSTDRQFKVLKLIQMKSSQHTVG